MNIFEKRPLSLILCIMLGGFSLFLDVGIAWQLTAIGASLFFILLIFIIKEPKIDNKPLCCVAASSLAISVLLAIIYCIFNYLPNYHGKKYNIKAWVVDADHSQSYYSRLDLEIYEINGKRVNYRVISTPDKEDASGIVPGHKVELVGTLLPFEATASGFDERSYYLSRGYKARLTDVSSVRVLEFSEAVGHNVLKEWRTFLSDELKKASNNETGGFLAALILGDTESLDPNTKLNFTSAGISHLLALSGMHLVILSEAVKKILGLFKLNKKFIVSASSAFAVFYMLLTGCPQSVVRATVMLLITNILFLFANTHDSYTTLPLSVALIIAFQPYAVYDLSLWLSAFATLGILSFTEYRGKDETRRPLAIRALVWCFDAILSTIFSIGACYAIMAINFKTFSVVAPITTLIFSVPVNALIYLGIILLIVPSSIPLGTPIIWITDTIKEGVELFSNKSWMPLSLDFPAVTAIIAVFCVVFFSLLIFNLKHKRIISALAVFLFTASIAVGAVSTQAIRNDDGTLFSPRKYSDNLLIKSEGTVAAIYTGSHSQSSAWSDLEVLNREKILFLDKLILTSYTDDTTIYVMRLICDVKTDTLYLPTPHGSYEMEQAESLAQSLSLFGTKLKFYECEEEIKIGAIAYRQLMRSYYLPGEISSEIYSITADGKMHTYLSDGAAEYFGALAYRIYDISHSLTFGGYGCGTSDSYKFTYIGENLKELYFADISLISEEALKYYKEKEVPVYEIGTS